MPGANASNVRTVLLFPKGRCQRSMRDAACFALWYEVSGLPFFSSLPHLPFLQSFPPCFNSWLQFLGKLNLLSRSCPLTPLRTGGKPKLILVAMHRGCAEENMIRSMEYDRDTGMISQTFVFASNVLTELSIVYKTRLEVGNTLCVDVIQPR